MNSMYENCDILNNPYECFALSSKDYPFPIKPHYHYFMEMLYITKGIANVTCDGVSHRVLPGQLILFPPSSVHAIFVEDSSAPLEFLGFKFDLNQLSSSVHSSDAGILNFYAILSGSVQGERPPIHFTFDKVDDPNRSSVADFYSDITLSKGIRNMFESCLREANEQRYGYQSVIRSCISNLMICLLRIWRDEGYDTDIASSAASRNNDIYSITEYIDKHLQDDLHVEELAELCHMSYSYFAKTFRALYGQSCKQYISFLRLCKVENMLLFTNHDLSYISQETGFSDCSHLIHVFKGKYGLTPHQFRLERRSSTLGASGHLDQE